ncbi:hypothetical protein PISMIDRAFT_96826, partial [Pisolithus microcarpus 441]
ELNVDPLTLSKVEAMVRKDFGGIGPFPTYILLSTKKSMPPLSANPFTLSVPASHCPLTHITIPLLHGLRMFSRCRIPPLLIFWLDLIELLGFVSSLTNTLGIVTLQMTSYIRESIVRISLSHSFHLSTYEMRYSRRRHQDEGQARSPRHPCISPLTGSWVLRSSRRSHRFRRPPHDGS